MSANTAVSVSTPRIFFRINGSIQAVSTSGMINTGMKGYSREREICGI